MIDVVAFISNFSYCKPSARDGLVANLTSLNRTIMTGNLPIDHAAPEYLLELIRALFKHEGEPDIRTVKGPRHEVFKIKCGDHSYVFKILGEGDRFQQREILARALLPADFPAPPILHSGVTEDNRYWIVMESIGTQDMRRWLLGLNRDIRDSHPAISEIFYECGKLLARIHCIQFGEQEGLPRSLYCDEIYSLGYGTEAFGDNLLAAVGRAIDLLGEGAQTPILTALRSSAQQCLPYTNMESFCHGDYKAKNVQLTEASRVAGIIDWECIHVGSPLTDVAQFLQHARQYDDMERFAEGYSKVIPSRGSLVSAAFSYRMAEVVLGLKRPQPFDEFELRINREYIKGCAEIVESKRVDTMMEVANELLRYGIES
ncbi:MAG: hypothetical protein EPN70_18895 [Paraburkholderia sp.]|uniref:phosphotransferase family protein n=1 Tax=Paraburkholderia sp. TaxID=1926495 RepID=UPI00120FF2B7|nr:phosphotransferase [Paraburkholderia sp.]TAM01665.1 MAG: hypothetical protein EPN70_18895 [Paraburkholderia sp.]TAM29919.1 MAG: hypothetical protein EPN59_10765 [Paraburkholderia sp.]